MAQQDRTLYESANNFLGYPGHVVAQTLGTQLPNYISQGANALFGKSDEYKQQQRKDQADFARFDIQADDPYRQEKLKTARWKDYLKSTEGNPVQDMRNKREANQRKKTGISEQAWNQLNAANAIPTSVSNNSDVGALQQSALPKEQQDWFIAQQKAAAKERAVQPSRYKAQVANPNASSFAQAMSNSTGINPIYPDESQKTLDFLSSQGFNPRKNNPNMTAEEQYNEFFDNVKGPEPVQIEQGQGPLLIPEEKALGKSRSVEIPMRLPPQKVQTNTSQAPANMSAMQALDSVGLIPKNPIRQDAPGIYKGAGYISSFGDNTVTNNNKPLDRSRKGVGINDEDRLRNREAFNRMYPDYNPNNSSGAQGPTAESRAYNKAGRMDPNNMRRHNMEQAAEGYVDMGMDDYNVSERNRMGFRTPSNNTSQSRTPLKRSAYRGPANPQRLNPQRLGATNTVDSQLMKMDSPSQIQKSNPNSGVSSYTSVQSKKKPIRDGFIDEYMKSSMG